MSHYATIPMKFKFKDELIKSLESIYGYGNVEIHEVAVHLVGYHGDIRPEKANLIVRRQHIGGSSNDLGFVLDKNTGMYSMIVSEYDKSATVTDTVVEKLVTGYAQRVIKNRLPRGKYRITSDSPNQITLQVTS